MATKKHQRAGNTPKDGVAVKGAFRLTITDEDGTVAGDSGWRENIIVSGGFLNFMANQLMHNASSSYVSALAIGTGSTPFATDTFLVGEISGSTQRLTNLTTANASASSAATASFTGTFASSANFLAASSAISNIGLFATSTGSTLFAGNTYASSPCSTNQNVNCTYTIVFHS